MKISCGHVRLLRIFNHCISIIMIYNFSFFIIIVIIASIQAFPYQDVEQQIGSKNGSQMTEIILNDRFDLNLPLIRGYIKKNGMEPLQIPDHIITFTDLGVGKVHLQRGLIQNLVRIKRTGDVILHYNNKFLYFDFDLGWDNLYMTCDYTMRYLLLTRKGSFTGSFRNLRVRVLGTFNLNTHFLKLEFFKIVDVDDFTIRLEGHLSDHLINVLTKVLTLFARNQVLRKIEYQSTVLIKNKINEINELKPNVIDNIMYSVFGISSNVTII
ncbi:uncharacterized protein LOC123263692 [Cotesia glomerata]|uniref:uncharacterized protein LOC123263692 n=1 Tax=Cotesia glomerata TaxID=32391 RepID=UPI001D013A89|nr:uncharacterized protein LOC123263692 [Cotesia glomerata]